MHQNRDPGSLGAMETVNVCRCCLSEGFHKDLKVPYVWMNNIEIYEDMLHDCFSVSLSSSPYVSSSICDLCIGCLRSALSFKQQVLRAEASILEKLSETDGKDVKLLDIKEEPNFSSDGNTSDDYTLAETVKIEYGEELLKELKSKPVPKRKAPAAARKTDSKKKVQKPAPDTKVKANLKLKSPKKTIKWTTAKDGERDKQRHNLQTLLQFSNATPFAMVPKMAALGFNCAFCNSTHPEPEDLRLHVNKDHVKERTDFKTLFEKYEYCVKVDIEHLTCTLCGQEVNNVASLAQHLVNVHKKTYYLDVKDTIVPYKLDKRSDLFECVLCSSSYERFKMLAQHMNKHCGNYVCKTCGATFVTKRSIDCHMKIHEDGDYKCPMCEKVFSNKIRLRYHARMVHCGRPPVSKCTECNVSFNNYYQRNQHMVKVHKTEAEYKCNVCGRQFLLKTLLMYHIKNNHLMEKNVACPDCGKRFFSNRTLKGHMVKHTGEKNYVCDICKKAYARRFTLREHMRIHNNDRRFKCDVCEMTFVQKCSLKSHLLTHHGISMAAEEITASV